MKLVLASGSPRRRELLEQAGFTLQVAPSDVDETPEEGEDPVDFALRMAEAKAEGAPPGVVVAADTVVHVDGRIFGKPAHPGEAVAMLETLSGAEHVVTTAFCVVKGERAVGRTVSTLVRFRALSPGEIRGYVATGEPFDKAGGYGIQGLAAGFVEEIAGSYTNVVGLPLAQVLETLAELGVHSPLTRVYPLTTGGLA